MPSLFGNNCSIALPWVSFVNVYHFVCVLLSLVVLRVEWDLTVLVPDHCRAFYFEKSR